MRRFIIALMFFMITLGISAQKSRVLSVIQMIEQGKYKVAKEQIDLAVLSDKTVSWPRTYYVRGLLCQTAYEDGFGENDLKKTKLYPDQLYLAYDSYELALELDTRQKLDETISQKYYLLSNDFKKMGIVHFKSGEFKDALRAFEHALLINKSDLIHAQVDTSLIYNAAMAAYKSESWEKSIGYLMGLHEHAYSPASSLVLYHACTERGDTLRAEKVLLEGLELYNYDNQIVVNLIDLFVRRGEYEEALRFLDEAIGHHPDNYRLFWEKGLIYRRMDDSEKAISSFKSALALAPDDAKIYYNIGVVYYNMGIDLREESLKIKDNNDYRVVRDLSRKQFREAVIWLEKSYEIDPFNESTISKLYQLYYQLHMKEKEASMKLLID